MLALDDLLEKTSRTFALAIPLLPEPTRRAVGVAYLLFRIADTFEDATAWPRAERIAALEDFARAVEQPAGPREAAARALVAQAVARPPVAHAGYLELLEQAPAVLAALDGLSVGVRAAVVRHTVRTARGMAQVVARADEQGRLHLASVKDLQDYCYVVAGIVGELLTEVFLLDAPQLEAELAALSRTTRGFGEGLQLVNILKDSFDDARDGRVYLPAQTPRAEVFALARADLAEAGEYVRALQRGGAPDGYLGFTGLSLTLAHASLDKLEREGPGAKVSRDEVARLFGALQADIERGVPLQLGR